MSGIRVTSLGGTKNAREPRVYLAATDDTKEHEAAYVLDVLALPNSATHPERPHARNIYTRFS
jgi:hypothetical protein